MLLGISRSGELLHSFQLLVWCCGASYCNKIHKERLQTHEGVHQGAKLCPILHRRLELTGVRFHLQSVFFAGLNTPVMCSRPSGLPIQCSS